jgi:prepilin-type N-terminal cleavage/methylation domain-containing protein
MTQNRGFTLVEILIVVIILAILAAVVLPQFSNASQEARSSMLRDDLRLLRAQVQVFKAQHRGVAPGYPNCDPTAAPDEATFVAHLTMASNTDGATAAPGTPGFRWGPYMSRMPPNPVNELATVQMLQDADPIPANADDSHGYVYHAATQTLLADSPGVDPKGVRYIDY